MTAPDEVTHEDERWPEGDQCLRHDDVWCNNCNTRSLVYPGRNDCPNCKMDGSLAWTDEARPHNYPEIKT